MPPSIARESDQAHHVLALDGWRGLAVIVVLMGHFGADRYVPNVSSFGVDLFFVLSGRLMADILFVETDAASDVLRQTVCARLSDIVCFRIDHRPGVSWHGW